MTRNMQLAMCIGAVTLVSSTQAANEGESLAVPRWDLPQPDFSKPLGGYSKLQQDFKVEVLHGGKDALPGSDAGPVGSYNHNLMLDYLQGDGFFLMWKNCLTDEDCNGQRFLYSRSADARNWSVPNVFLPNLTTPGHQLTLEPGPCIHVNGRLYCGGSPGFHNTTHDASAQGSQFCLWPDPLNPRNCGPPSPVEVHYNNSLLVREVRKGGSLGPMFWAAPVPPAQFVAASKAFNIPSLPEMDLQTQDDFRSLDKTFDDGRTPCAPESDGTLKCEACAGGCQIYDSINFSLGMANERTHFIAPSSNAMRDTILYRSGKTHTLWASVRNGTEQESWTAVVETNIPNGKSNLNAGPLPDGRVYLVHNPMNPTQSNAQTRRRKSSISARDPVTVAVSSDGVSFDAVGVALTCTDLSPDSTCKPRFAGHAKNTGPSYPQALTVVAPAPETMHGFYVASSNNKEDIWIAKVVPPSYETLAFI